MQRDPFEKQLYKEITGYDSALDLDKGWTELEQKRYKRRRRYPLWWMWGLGMLVIFGLGMLTAVYWWQLPAVSTESALSKQHQRTTTPVLNSSSSPLEQASLDEKTNLFKDKDVQNRNIKGTSTTTKTNKSSLETSIPSLPYSNTKETSLLRQQSKSIPQESSSSRTKNIDQNTNFATITSTGLSVPLVEQNNVLKPAVTSEHTATRSNLTSENANTTAFSRLSLLPITLLKSVLPFVEQNNNSPKLRIPETPLPTKSFAQNAFTWSVGYAQQSRTLTTSGGSRQLRTINLRNVHEIPFDMWQADMQYKRYFTKNCFVETGLAYQQWFTQLRYQQSYTSRKLQGGQIIQINEYQSGQRELIENEAFVSNTYELKANAWQKQSVLHIPLSIGFEWKWDPQWGLRASTGISYAFYYQQSGAVLRPIDDSEYYELTQFEQLPERTQGFWQAQLNGQLFYQFHPNWQWFGGIQTTMDLNSRLQSNTKDKLYHRSVGGKIGLSYLF